MGIKSRGGSVPAGVSVDYHGGAVPAGWLLCFGQAVSREQYAKLFNAIGTDHGAGDGVTTFNLPDSRGRATFGKDDMGGVAANRLTSGVSGVNGETLGAVGGGQSVTLTAAQMPTHTHSQNAHSHSGVFDTTGETSTANGVADETGINSFRHTPGSTNGATATNNNNGSSSAHSNVPPALVANKMIKY